MASPKTLPSLVEDLRRAIQESGLTTTELAQHTGITQPQLSRFVRGIRTLTLPAADKICRHLGLRLVQQAAPGKKK